MSAELKGMFQLIYKCFGFFLTKVQLCQVSSVWDMYNEFQVIGNFFAPPPVPHLHPRAALKRLFLSRVSNYVDAMTSSTLLCVCVFSTSKCSYFAPW